MNTKVQGHTTDWWVNTMAEAVTDATTLAVKEGSETVRLLEQTGSDCEFVTKARASAAKCRAAATDASAAMVGLKWFWHQYLAFASPKMRLHQRLLVGAAFSACSVGVAFFLIPFDANAKQDGGDLEREVVTLIEAGEYDRAVTVLTKQLDTPRGWHLRGELERKRGDEFRADEFYLKAASAGYEPSQWALLTPAKNCTRGEVPLANDDAVPGRGSAVTRTAVVDLHPPCGRSNPHPLARCAFIPRGGCLGQAVAGDASGGEHEDE